jgi:hypothetical protein
MTLKFKKEAEQFARSIGVNSISWIGEGDNGAAYETDCGKIVKITKDKDEFVCANKLLNEKHPNMAEIYNIDLYSDDTLCILMEKLETKGVNMLFRHLMLESEEQNCHFSELDMEELIYGLPDEAMDLADCIMSASRQAASSGFHANDVHEENIGQKKNGDFALYDQRTGWSNKEVEKEYQLVRNKILNKDLKLNWATEDNAERPNNFTRPEYQVLQVNIKDLFANMDDDFTLDIQDSSGGKNAIGDRVKKAVDHFKAGEPMDYSEVSYSQYTKKINVDNGRHRALAAFQLGKEYIPMFIYKKNIDMFKKIVKTKPYISSYFVNKI